MREGKDMPRSTLTSKGQTTIPKEIRDHLGISSGDRIDFFVNRDGIVYIRPALVALKDLKGILHREGMKPVSIEEMNAAVRRRFGGGR